MPITRLGILGGGQLARMLAEAAFRLGYRPLVLAANADEPAAQICPGAVFGSWNDPVTLRRFLSQVDCVAFENEFVPRASFESAGVRPDDPRFGPRPEVMYLLQDKLSQKRVLNELRIPTSRHVPFSSTGRFEDLEREFPQGFVLKWARLGYDGKGTWIQPPRKSKETLAAFAAFCGGAAQAGVELFAEEKIRFRRELAIVAARSRGGEFAAYPLVISEQENGICRRVTGPALSLGVAASLEAQASDSARRLAERLQLVGVFALEFFETESGELLVNEIAPRVHNTGHYTQDASDCSQFENHWRALLGLPLGATRSASAFAMLNLIGGPANGAGLPRPTGRARLHWYGKKEFRPGRKLGHLNTRCDSSDELAGALAELESIESDWMTPKEPGNGDT